jgi:hypothetical protein
MRIGAIGTVVGWLVLALVVSAPVRAAGPQYHLKPGDLCVYEITVTVAAVRNLRTTTSYLVLRPQNPDVSTGEMTVLFDWLPFREKLGAVTYELASLDSLLPRFSDPPDTRRLRQLRLGPHGVAGNTETIDAVALLDGRQGPAWQLVLPPLPAGDELSWKTKASRMVEQDQTGRDENGQPIKRLIETPCDETVSYSLGQTVDHSTTIQREYDLSSLEKSGDDAVFALRGDGAFEFDARAGQVVSLQWNMKEYFKSDKMVEVPVTTSARLLTGDDFESLEKAVAIRQRVQAAARRREAHLAHELLPGMVATTVPGTHMGGGPFTTVSSDRKPVIGFLFEPAMYGKRDCFRNLDPIYEPPMAEESSLMTAVVAKDGYAVGGVSTCNNEFLNAIQITFMRITASGLDVNDSYQSPWYGKQIGAQTHLGGAGQMVVGATGRKGLNVDRLGLVLDQASPGH